VTDRRLRWFSSGAASAVATSLDIRKHGLEVGVVVTCDTGSEDEDNHRFAVDCEAWFGCGITVLKSDEYENTWDLWRRRRYMSGIDGAICTGEFKFAPRLDFQLPSDIHIFGYTADASDVARAKRLRETYPEMNIETPLIDRGITKAGCLAIIQSQGIELPRSYGWGFPNANCLRSGCCKSQSMDYWALHRKMMPEGFAETAAIARDLGVKMVITGREKQDDGTMKNIRGFIDDIPLDQPTLNPIAPVCDFLCHIAEQDLAE
jgi:hypothetical protein